MRGAMDTNNRRCNARVLVVDDEIIIRHVIADALREERYDVAEAASGEEALARLQSDRFEVVISDITMAKVSGIDLLFKIKELNPETEVILITGYASLETAEAAVAGKAYRYLRKPFNDLDDVIKVVEEAIASQQAKKEEREKIEDLVTQRNRLEKRLGQLETMYSISHAISFPEDTASLFREIAVLLFQVLKPDLIACYIDEKRTPEFGGLFIVLTRPFEESAIEHLIANIAEGNSSHGRVVIEKIYMRKGPPVQKLSGLIELTFPKRSIVEGILYIGYCEPSQLSEDEAQLLEVTTAQMAGAIGKLIELRQRERERLQSLFEKMGDGVVLFNEDSKITIANRASYHLLQVETCLALENKLSELGLTQNLNKLQEGHWTLGKKIEMNGKIVSVTILPLESRWEAAAIMVLRDITEHSKMQQELERTRRLSLMGELSAGVVHELNTPLAIILGYAQLLMDQQDIKEEAKGDIKKILEEGQRCQKIVSNLLGLAPSKVRERRLTDMQCLIEKVLELKRHDLRKAKIKVISHYPERPTMAQVDPGQIQQVLLNLIKNSQDAMENESDVKELRIALESREKVYISVEDTGPGIPLAYMEQIFNPFFTTKPSGKGSGLGLSISHKIIGEHEGRLWCKNGAKGAIFTIVLPLAPEA